MATFGRARARRGWLSLALAWTLVAAGAGPTAAEDPDIDGSYDTVWTSPPACNAPAIPVGLKVERTEPALVRFTLEDGSVYRGSIDPGLNFDLTSKIDQWTGHFTLLSDGGATMAGELTDPDLSCDGVPIRIAITGKRAGASESTPMPSASPSGVIEGFPGFLIANEALRKACEGRDPARLAACAAAQVYADGWDSAMELDIAGVPDPMLSEEARALEQLVRIQFVAAKMAALEMRGPCGASVPAFPVIRGMILVFGKAFGQAITAASAGRQADLDRIVTLADALLGYAEAADAKSLVSSAPCPSTPA
jgi:hypothetical protein